MEKSSFFNSVGGDRVYKAEEWAEYFASFIGNGVFPVPSNGLQVEANSRAGVVIRAGRAWINGYFYFNTDDLNVKLNTADGVLNRIDRIVIRWDLTARTISAEVKSSAPSNNPTTPDLQRDADAYELCLADVYVRAGSTAVLQSDITDQRYNSGLCGVVKGTVDQIDASMLAKQFNDYAELFKQETKLDFEAWFEEIRGILSEDLAGSLALAIDDINRSKGQPGGIASLDDGGKLAQMPTAEDIAAIPLSQKGIANGIATLTSSGKLAQMPTAADVGAIPLTNEGTWTPEVIEMLNSTGGCTYTSRAGHYIRIGKLTLVTFGVVVAKKPTTTNWNNYVQVCIKGMPGPLARQNQAYSMGARVVLKAGDAPIAASTHLAYNTIAYTIPSGSLSTNKLGDGFELRGSIAYISS